MRLHPEKWQERYRSRISCGRDDSLSRKIFIIWTLVIARNKLMSRMFRVGVIGSRLSQLRGGTIKKRLVSRLTHESAYGSVDDNGRDATYGNRTTGN